MWSAGDTEVFIPVQACVVTIPVRSLPRSITRKMSVCPVHSNQPATFISPVELRSSRGATHKPPALTPGQFSLPVVTSNRKAFRILRNFLQSGETSLQFSDEHSQAGSEFSKRRNSIVMLNTQIFLIMRKAKSHDRPLEQQSPTPSESVTPPLISPQDTGSDITGGRSKEHTCGAEDDVKSSEKPSDAGREDVMECDAQNDDITGRKRSKDDTDVAEDDGKSAEMLKERESEVIKDREENDSQLLTQDTSMKPPSTSERSRKMTLEKKSEAQSSLANTEECNAGEIWVAQRRTGNSNAKVTSERGHANKTSSSSETHTGIKARLSDNLTCRDKETQISTHESSLAKAKCRKCLIFGTCLNKDDAKGQISEISKTKASVGAGEIASAQSDNTDSQKNTEAANSKCAVHVQMSEGQSSRCKSVVEIVDVTDDVSSVSSDTESAVVTSVCKAQDLLEKFKSLRRRISDCVSSQDSALKVNNRKRCHIAAETANDCNNLIIVESCVEDKRVTAESDTEAMEVGGSGGGTDEPNRHLSINERLTNKTSSKRVCNVASSSSEAKGADEIIDVDDDPALRKSDVNQNATNSQQSSVKVCKGSVKTEDLNDNDGVVTSGRTFVSTHGDVVNRCKRKIFTDETNSDVAATTQISGINGSHAKRAKRGDGVNFSTEGVKSDVILNSRQKSYNRDDEIIEIDDDDDDDEEIHKRANNRNGNVAERGGKTYERYTKAEISIEASDRLNYKKTSDETESLLSKNSDVEIVMVTEKVRHEIKQGVNKDDTFSKKHDTSAEGLMTEAQSSYNKSVINVENCIYSDVFEVQSERAAEMQELRNEREEASCDELNCNVIKSRICVSETLSAAEDLTSARKSCSDGTNQDSARSGSDYEDEVEVELVEDDLVDEDEDKDLASANLTDKPNRYVTTSESCAEDQIGDYVSPVVTSEHCGIDHESQEDQSGEPWPTSLPAQLEFDYMGLRREENIDRIRARLRGMEEKLNTLMSSHH